MGPTSLFVRGPFRGSSGYAHHTREFVLELIRKGVALRLESVPGWGGEEPVPADSADYWYETLTEPVDARIALQFCMPHQTEDHPDLIDVNYTMFEADRIPSTWVALSKLIDWTIVPTEFSRIAWIESGAPEGRLRVCPLGVRSELFAGTHEPWPVMLTNGRPLATYRFRFLNVSTWNTRKNLDGLVRTWLTATRASDDAALVIKVGLDSMDLAVTLPRMLADCEHAAGKMLADAAPLHFEHGFLTDEQMPRFYAAGTHYISLSHGEGWDLPMMEAMATGLIPIAPDHSPYRCYLDNTSALLIPSHLARVPHHLASEWFRHLNWWNADEANATELIRAVLDDDLAPAVSARDRILGDYGWELATDRLLQILSEVESISPAPA